jgi:hypothetical protein
VGRSLANQNTTHFIRLSLRHASFPGEDGDAFYRITHQRHHLAERTVGTKK